MLSLLYQGEGIALAKENNADSNVIITVVNDQTGEVTTYKDSLVESNELNRVFSTNMSNLDDSDEIYSESYSSNYELFIPFESNEVSIFDNKGDYKTSNGVTARLNVNYDRRASGKDQQIRLNRVWGSWTPSSKHYNVSSRQVNAHSGSIWGKKLEIKPTQNTFSRTTNWGYNIYGGGDASPRAWSSAKITISSMGSTTYTISLEFTFG
ncbi:hypothetical protein [Shouchella miscanthi]|uniref:Uncharacterized protein n=1 Tax=Shouchella miscanthi TaxID=2598861 RepID=A0ABU6NNV8_9BACI|nr:hypothetical protein [Shouchella miscanthi]